MYQFCLHVLWLLGLCKDCAPSVIKQSLNSSPWSGFRRTDWAWAGDYLCLWWQDMGAGEDVGTQPSWRMFRLCPGYVTCSCGNWQWPDVIQPQDIWDADGTTLPPCHDLRATANWDIPQLGLRLIWIGQSHPWGNPPKRNVQDEFQLNWDRV